MSILDSFITSNRARAEQAYKNASRGSGLNPEYVSTVVNQKPKDYVDGTGIAFGSYPIDNGLVQKVQWNESTEVWDDFGNPVATANYTSSFFTRKINTVSDLEGVTPSFYEGLFGTTPTRQLLGYNSVGDSGGGTLVWDPDRDKQDHNGVTVFSPTWANGTFGDTQDANWYAADGSDTGTGCWVRNIGAYINIRWAGAKTSIEEVGFNSQYAIQKCIDIVSDQSGGYILIPSAPSDRLGDGEGYQFEQLDLKAQGVEIIGESKTGSVLKVIDTSTASNAIIAHHPRQSIKNLTIMGNRDNVTGLDCIDSANSEFTGFQVYQDLQINKFDGTGIKFKNAHMSSLIDVSIGRIKVGLHTERTRPLNFYGLDIGKWTEKGIYMDGSPSPNVLYGKGLFLEATVDTPVAGAQAIHLENFRADVGDTVDIDGFWLNGHSISQGYDIVGIEIDTPIFADNISISGSMLEVATPFNFISIDEGDIGNVDFKQINVIDSGAVKRTLGIDSYDILEFYEISPEIDISLSGTHQVIGFQQIGSIRIQKVDLRVLSATGSTQGTVDLGIEGAGGIFGTIDVPTDASVNTIIDVTDQLTNFEFVGLSQSRIVCSADAVSTGTVQLQIKATIYDQIE